MSVRQKKQGGQYYYEYMFNGERKRGVCEGCTTKRDAEKFERELRRVEAETAREVAKADAVDKIIEIRRRELTGNAGIPLEAAFTLAMKKPRKRQPGKGQLQSKQSVFADFVAFMHGEYPDITELAAVTKSHAEAYISHIQTRGRYVVRNSYTRNGKTIERATRKIETGAADGSMQSTDASTIPSPRTQKLFLTTCEEVFRMLMEDAGLGKNPFSGINVAADNPETREAFSDEELSLIYENLDDFTRPLFMMAVYTGMREGDICTLRLSEVDTTKGVICRTQRKTGRPLEIPIASPLYAMLQNPIPAANKRYSEYVFPEHAEMYLTNRCGVSRRVKQFLERIGIATTRTPEGRSRAVSVKDLHSCRHTFCYIAGRAGVPLSIVQSIVGHMTPEMTKRYQAHATLRDKQSGIDVFSNSIMLTHNGGNAGRMIEISTEPERAELLQLVQHADISLVKRLLTITKNDYKM